MAEMFFSLRFQSQLRRTRPALLRHLERSIRETMESFGGKVKSEYRLIRASFDSGGIGFALDMLCLLENLSRTLERVSPDLYGYICVFGEDIDEDNIHLFIRELPAKLWSTGIWCGPGIRKILGPFIDFEGTLSWPHTAPLAGYALIKEGSAFLQSDVALRPGWSFGKTAAEAAGGGDNSERINQYLKQGPRRSTAIVGDEFIGKREGLYRYCAAVMGDFPPLVIRFGGGNPVIRVVDSFSPEIQKVLAAADTERLESEAALLFRERLRDEVSEFFAGRCGRFFKNLLEAYRAAAVRAKTRPVLIIENLQDADSFAQRIVCAGCASLAPEGTAAESRRYSGVTEARSTPDEVCAYGTCTDMAPLKIWEELFPRVIKFTTEKKSHHDTPSMPIDLWEIVYACALFNRYFPAYLFPRLLAEEGKNPEMIERTLALLADFRLVNSVSNPSIRMPETVSHAERILGKRTERIRRVVRNRLLDWIKMGRLKPCFRLLEALHDLGGTGSDELMLEAVYNDVINGVYTGLEQAADSNRFVEVIGKERFVPLRFIFTTFKALSHGNQEDIRSAFTESVSLDGLSSDFRSWITVARASYRLSVCDPAAASTAVKEAMLIAQEENSGRFLAHIYRLFSLVNIANLQLSEALDYFAFAQEEADKTGKSGECALIGYYSAAAHFVFGNISKAERLALQAEEAALVSGRPEWADRTRFFRGRLRFESGRYQDALDMFKALETNHWGKGGADFEAMLAAWIYRAAVYRGNTSAPPAGGLDARLFEIEGAFLARNYRKTLELTVVTGDALTRDRFLFIEQPDWRSGFAQCELLLFPLRELWERMLLTYRALALCHLGGAEQRDKDEAIREMRRVMRDELPENDPNDAFYFYAYYQVLKRTGAPEVDLNTAISLAFKRLQRRASRIDDNETKRAFLSSQHWNGALEVSAREHKLI
jgi:hypothetical protein